MKDRVKLARIFLKEDLILKYSTILSIVDNLVFQFISIGSKRKIIKAYSEYQQGAGVPYNIASLIILANYRTKAKIRSLLNNGTKRVPINFTSSIFQEETLKVALQDLAKHGFANFRKKKRPNII